MGLNVRKTESSGFALPGRVDLVFRSVCVRVFESYDRNVSGVHARCMRWD
jgi:hypothetical protein